MSFTSWVYSLPSTWNPVVPRTRITSAWANGTLNDIVTALNALATAVTTMRPYRLSAAGTITPSQIGQIVTHPSSDTTARIWTIQANATQAWPDGAVLSFRNNNGAGVITITPTDTMRLAGTASTGNRTLAANGVATAVWDATDSYWLISGTGLT